MKKLFALMLALCLMLGCTAVAETAELDWASVLAQNPDLEANGTYQQISLGEAGTIVYWVPNDLAPVDVNTIEAEVPPIAAFGGVDEDGTAYTLSVFALQITSLEEYSAGLKEQGADVDNAQLVIANGIQTVAIEAPALGIDLLLIPVTETMVLVYTFTPQSGEVWDQVKTYIVSSIQLAQ